jgi:hypothetical protein
VKIGVVELVTMELQKLLVWRRVASHVMGKEVPRFASTYFVLIPPFFSPSTSPRFQYDQKCLNKTP